MAKTKSTARARALSRLQIVDPIPTDEDLVRYTGSRADLIAAGVAEPGMFPEKLRKWFQRTGRRFYHCTKDYYSVTRRGPDEFIVTRWNGRVTQAQREAEFAAWMADREAGARPAQRDAPAPSLELEAGDTGLFMVEALLDRIEAECTQLRRLGAEDEEVDAADVTAAAERILQALGSVSLMLHHPR